MAIPQAGELARRHVGQGIERDTPRAEPCKQVHGIRLWNRRLADRLEQQAQFRFGAMRPTPDTLYRLVFGQRSAVQLQPVGIPEDSSLDRRTQVEMTVRTATPVSTQPSPGHIYREKVTAPATAGTPPSMDR